MAATKQQEREALEKIRKIVEGLGENSYLGAAFDGVFELAEQNIENDFGLSSIDRAKAAEKAAIEREQKAAEIMIEARRLMTKAEDIKKKFETDRDYWADIRKSLDWAAYQLSDKLGY